MTESVSKVMAQLEKSRKDRTDPAADLVRAVSPTGVPRDDVTVQVLRIT